MQPLLQLELHKKKLSQKNKTEIYTKKSTLPCNLNHRAGSLRFQWGLNYCSGCRWRQERDKKGRQTKCSFRSRFIYCDKRDPKKRLKWMHDLQRRGKDVRKYSLPFRGEFEIRKTTLFLAPSFRFEDLNTKFTWLGFKGLVTLVFRFNPKTVCLTLATHDKFSAGRQLFPLNFPIIYLNFIVVEPARTFW